MEEVRGTIWIDVTMLVNWPGQLTGIQRVEYNLAKRFARKSNVKFCVFDKAARTISEFDFKHIAYKIDMLQSAQPEAQGAAEVDEAKLSLNYRRLLTRVRPLVGRTLPRESKARLRRQYHRLRGQVHTPAPAVDFLAGDVLLVLSGDWSDNTFADLIRELRDARGFKVLQIVYDMLPVVLPGYFVPGMPEQFSTYMERMLHNCDGVLAISESTKRDVVRFQKEHKLGQVPVKVFRLGEDFVEQAGVKPDISQTNVKKGQYILCVCTVEARKNHQLLYYAVREAQARGITLPPFVFVGKRGWLMDDFFHLVENDPVLQKQFIFLGRRNDQELTWLFQNCLMTVWPSFYEGWGLPVAESLFYGKLCVSSNSSSMPEIAGDDLVEYVSPSDPVALLEKLEYYSTHPDALQKKEARIKTKYVPTNWDDTFAEVDAFVTKYVDAPPYLG
jgi:glycosyltransferase involved in cell wall biosynthesis